MGQTRGLETGGSQGETITAQLAAIAAKLKSLASLKEDVAVLAQMLGYKQTEERADEAEKGRADEAEKGKGKVADEVEKEKGETADEEKPLHTELESNEEPTAADEVPVEYFILETEF